MPDNEIPAFSIQRIVQMLTQMVRMQFLFLRIDFSIAMDDHASIRFFPKNFSINVTDVFMQDDRDIGAAFPGVPVRVFKAGIRNRPIQEPFFFVIHDLQLVGKTFIIMLYAVLEPHGNEVFRPPSAADQSVDPIQSEIGCPAPVKIGSCVCEDGIQSLYDAAVIKMRSCAKAITPERYGYPPAQQRAAAAFYTEFRENPFR